MTILCRKSCRAIKLCRSETALALKQRRMSLIFPLLKSVPEEKADFLGSNGHETHSRKRGRKVVTEKLVRRTIPRSKSAWQPQEERNTGASYQLLCSATLSRRNGRAGISSEDNCKTLEKYARPCEKELRTTMVYQ